jgi:predicted NAD/FAD-dependent oxidoreductase
MSGEHSDILIIGAGMAGLSCATALAEAGRSVRLIDKGRGPGGRMAARRAEIARDIVSFDHGAQYFTARDSAFREAVEEWEKLGVTARWPAAGEDAWVGVPGMNGPIRAMAEALDVQWNMRALALTDRESWWHVDAGKDDFNADTLLVTIPAEQASELLSGIAQEMADVAGSVQSEPCWAVMAAFAQELDIKKDTVRGGDGERISWAARNSAKPMRAGRECWVIHASPKRSRAIIDLPPEEAATWLLDDFFTRTGAECVAPVHVAAHRWLYAMPEALEGEPARYDEEKRIGIAGDYLHSPRVEGAWLSGRALAETVLAQ